MVVDWVHDIGEAAVAGASRTQPDRVVHAAELSRRRLTRFIDERTGHLPSTEKRVNEPAGLIEDGQAIDVVPMEDLTAVITTAPLVVLQVPRVLDSNVEVLADPAGVQILIGQVDGVRVGVVQFPTQTPLVLDPEARLETVVC